MKQVTRTAVAAAIVALTLGGAARAEDAEHKRALIDELIAIAGPGSLGPQMAEQQSLVELGRIRRSYEPMMDFAVKEQTELTDEQRQALRERLADFDAFAGQFQRRFVERLDFESIIGNVYRPLYDRYFSEEDLKRMVEFYQTPVGRKAIQIMPALTQEAGVAIDRVVRPEAVRIIQDIVADEVKNLGG